MPTRQTDADPRPTDPSTDGPSTDGPDARESVETAVPPGATAHACERCGRPFAHESYLALHRGLAHGAALTDEERAAYAAALDDERDDLRRFRIVALGGLVLLYFGFLFAYALFT